MAGSIGHVRADRVRCNGIRGREKQNLIFKCIGTQWPAVMKTTVVPAPVLVVNLGEVFGGECSSWGASPFLRSADSTRKAAKSIFQITFDDAIPRDIYAVSVCWNKSARSVQGYPL